MHKPRTLIPVLAIAALSALPSAASAGVPSWSSPMSLAAKAGAGDVAIDGKGELTAVWGVYGGGAFVSERLPHAERFGAARPLDQGKASNPKLAVNDAGGGAVLWSREASSTCDGLACRSTVRVRLRRPGGDFRAPQEMPSSLGISYSDVAVAGDEAIVAWDTRGGGLRVAHGALSGSIGGAQLLASGSETYDAPFSLAANGRGDAVIAWTVGVPDEQGISVMASLRRAGGRFGPPEVVFDGGPATEYDPTVSAAIDAGGRASVAFSPAAGQASVARRSDGGWQPQALGAGFGPQLVSNRDGDLMAWWHRAVPVANAFPRYETHFELAEPGRAFSSSKVLPVGNGAPVLGGFDALRNAIFVSAGPQPGQNLVAGTLNRFGVSEMSTLNTEASQAVALAVNGRGAAVALSLVFQPEGGTRLVVIDRRADTSDPRMRLLAAKATPVAVSALVRCDEACRVRVGAPGRRAFAARSGPRRAQLVAPRRRARIRIAIPAKQRARLRKALRGRSQARIPLTLRVEDAAGNLRLIRRKVLLRGG